ncbi:MAG TPA: endonuclease V [Nitrososphaera sp.]|jgi:deoxyribonuclease V
MTDYSDAVRLQQELAKKIVTSDSFDRINNICGVDVAYDNDVAYCSAVVMDRAGAVIETARARSIARHPYVPGLLMLREAEPVFRALKKLNSGFDLLLVDGHGLLHPRKCGLACYVGVTIDKPTIGVAKKFLCGKVRSDGAIELDGQILGHDIDVAGKKKLYVSVGHRISLETAVKIVIELGKGGMPEPLRLADIDSKMQKREKGP